MRPCGIAPFLRKEYGIRKRILLLWERRNCVLANAERFSRTAGSSVSPGARAADPRNCDREDLAERSQSLDFRRRSRAGYYEPSGLGQCAGRDASPGAAAH